MTGASYDIAFRLYPYRRSPDQDVDPESPTRHQVIIVGGGPVGLALSLDLGLRGIPVLVLDDSDGVGAGSRAICFSKRTLEVMDRLGAGDPMVDKGVVWSVGRVFRDERQIFQFNLLPEAGHKRPAFINLQQPYFEKFLYERVTEAKAAGAPIEVRGRNQVTGLTIDEDHSTLTIETPDGPYRLEAEWLLACDGARSGIRSLMGLGFEGRVFEDNFLIVDVTMDTDFPTERRFWFDPPFNRGQSALLHKQPDGMWRIDFQLGWDIDREAVVRRENVIPRVKAMLGPETGFTIEWVSVYTFQCCAMSAFRHGRVLFAGDAAHLVSPFGARGCNGGIQDVENLAWKLALVIEGNAPDSLLDSYDFERRLASDENVLNSTRATDFMTPKSPVSRMLRESVLDLARDLPFAVSLVNSGRLSVPATYDGSPLNSPDRSGLPARTRPGSPVVDAPTGNGWLTDRLTGEGFQLLSINCDASPPSVAESGTFGHGRVALSGFRLDCDRDSQLAQRYLGDADQAVYLFRPDQHVAARWRRPEPDDIAAALSRALAVSRDDGTGDHPDVGQGHGQGTEGGNDTMAEFASLNTAPNFDDPDRFYDELVKLHEGLSEAESHALNSRLILIFGNHIGDQAVLAEAFRAAARVGEGDIPDRHQRT